MQKSSPVYSAELVLHPARDQSYEHFADAAANPFEAKATTVSRVNAWWMAEAALATYWEPDAASAIYDSAGLKSQYVKGGSTDCYVTWSETFVIVAFRGTEPDEWQDVLTDANLVLKPWKTGKVHIGFKLALDAVWPSLLPLLQDLSASRSVWFCGHSLGAALATLAADLFPGTQGVCTFGSPRIGDRAFAQAFNAKLSGRTLRFVNNHDVVTHVPLPALPGLPGYKHVDLPRQIASDGTISSGEPEIAHFFAQLIGSTAPLLENINGLEKGTLKHPPNFLLDHMPKAYAIWTWNDHDSNR
jgi:triacylglycerol lipase